MNPNTGAQPRISIVMPTYNEEKDIHSTLDALIKLDYLDKELIIVDDSTDRTPQIIDEYISRGVRRLTQPRRAGRCGARNWGIQNATGAIVVILNADVQLPADFLTRIIPHYRNGADYVLVESKVINLDRVFARFVDAEGNCDYGMTDSIEWTEGFSCRRQAIMHVGLFPVGYAVPIEAGEDGYVGEQLRDYGYHKHLDRTIVVQHTAPSTLTEYWNQQIGRGKGFVHVRVFFQHEQLAWCCARLILKTIWMGLKIVTVLPILRRARRIAQNSARSDKDLWPFAYVHLVQSVAHTVGEWMAWWAILRATLRRAR